MSNPASDVYARLKTNGKSMKIALLRHLALKNRIYKQNHTRDAVLKNLLKTDDKKAKIHSDLKGMKN